MLTELEPLVSDLKQNRLLLDRVVGRLSEDEMNRPPREGEYSGRQTLAHLAGAERGMTALMRRMAAGESPRVKPDFSIDYYNARHQEKRAGLTVAQLRAELDESRRDLLAFMESLQPVDLDKRGEHPVAGEASVREILKVLQQHELDHIKELDAWSQQLIAARGQEISD